MAQQKFVKPINSEPEAVVDSLSVEYPATFTIESRVAFKLVVPCCGFTLAPGEVSDSLYFETIEQRHRFDENCKQIQELMGVPELVIMTYNGG